MKKLKQIFTGIFLLCVCAANTYGQNVSVGNTATANGDWTYAGGTYIFAPTAAADAYVTSADISSRMDTGDGTNPAGDVVINAPGNITTNAEVQIRHNSANPAHTTTWQAGGDILTSNALTLISQNGYKAHNIVLQAQGNITLNHGDGIKTMGQGAGASGGDITLRTETGNITMAVASRLYTNGVPGAAGQDGGTGGNVLIECAGIFTGSTDGIDTHGEAGTAPANGGNGGNITIIAGKVDFGGKAFYFKANGGTGRGTDTSKKGGNGGNIAMTSTLGNIIWGTTSMNTLGGQGENNVAGGNGGNITINAEDSLIITTTNSIGFYNYGHSGTLNNGGNGGNIEINASNIKITAALIFENRGGSCTGGKGGNAGNLSMHTTGNIEITGNREWTMTGGGGTANNASAGNGGRISLIADNGYIIRNQGNTNTSASSAVGTGLRGSGGDVYVFGANGVTFSAITANAGGGGAENAETRGNITVGTNNSFTTTGNTNPNSGLLSSIAVGNFTKTGTGTIVIVSGTDINGTATIQEGLLLIQNATSIPNAQDVILDGGYLQSTVSRTATTGKLKLTANGGGIVFDGTSTYTPNLQFPAYTAGDWAAAGVFTIKNWKETAGEQGENGKLFIGTTTTSLPDDQLAQVRFLQVPLPLPVSDYTAQQLASGEIVPFQPVPPSISIKTHSTETTNKVICAGESVTYTFEHNWNDNWTSSQVGYGQNPDGTDWLWGGDFSAEYQSPHGDDGCTKTTVARTVQFTTPGTYYMLGRAKGDPTDPYVYTTTTCGEGKIVFDINDAIEVTVNPAAAAGTIAASAPFMRNTETATISITDAYAGDISWYKKVGSGEYELVSEATDETLTIGALELGTYTYKAVFTEGSCTAESDEVIVKVVEPIVVTAKLPASWGDQDDIYVHYWGDANSITTALPKATLIEISCEDWVRYEFPIEVQSINVMFVNDYSGVLGGNNNNESLGTGIITESAWFTISEDRWYDGDDNNKHMVYTTTEPVAISDANPITIKVKNPLEALGWSDNLYVYSWNNCVAGAYVPMTQLCSESNPDWFKYTFNSTPINIVISCVDGGGAVWQRTIDILNISSDQVYEITNLGDNVLRGYDSGTAPIDEDCMSTYIKDVPTSDIIIYSHDHQIFAVGADDFTVYNLTGKQVPNRNLLAGVYIVKIGNKAYKAIVK
ncbi:MAG: hypothetical protein LBN95_08780 [Prevotellaceae bacterium]|jgi:hypothetical protein|nr:hypothetical protein [Prevotellaceae bacterium]